MSDQTSADVIEAAAKVIHDLAAFEGKRNPRQIAHALHDAHLLADPADRDAIKVPFIRVINRLQDQIARAQMEPGQDRQKAMHAYADRAERAEAEAAELRQKVADCELLLTDLGKTHTRVTAELDELRTTADRDVVDRQTYDDFKASYADVKAAMQARIDRAEQREVEVSEECLKQARLKDDAIDALERARRLLVAQQHALCTYGTYEGDGRTCDCKALGVGRPSAEQTGCVELRAAIRSLSKENS